MKHGTLPGGTGAVKTNIKPIPPQPYKLSRKILLSCLPVLIYLSFLRPFRHEALLPVVLLIFYPWIRKEPAFFIISGLVLFFVCMSFLQLSSPSIMIGFLFASVFSIKARSINDYELFAYTLVWIVLLSLFAGHLALYCLVAVGFLFGWSYKRYVIILAILLIVLIPVSKENWKWWQQIGPQGKSGKMILPSYLIQLDLPKIGEAGEGEEESDSLSVSNQPLIPHYFLNPEGVLHILFFLLIGIFIFLALRLLRFVRKRKKVMFRPNVLFLLIALACIALLMTGFTIRRFQVVNVVWEKGEFFKFAPRYSSAVVHPPLKEYPEYYFSIKPLLWNLDTAGKILGILDLIGLISFFSFLLAKRIPAKTLVTIEKKLEKPVSRESQKQIHIPTPTGSELLVTLYNHFRAVFEQDQELTPLEFQNKHMTPVLIEVTHEYIRTEYGMKNTDIPDEKIRTYFFGLSNWSKGSSREQ